MGVVHLAARPGGPRVALKVLRPHVVGDQEARARLAREVDTLSRVRSPRVAEVLDADPWGEVPFVVTRYVPGLSLQDQVRQEGTVRGDDLVHLGRCLAEALEAVHRVGVLHRDVKPSNVLMEGRNPVLIDFGLARLADDTRLTRVGWLLGTPGYLAPEILLGQDPEPASDVHSWGATVAYAATGRRPFGAGPDVAVMDRVRRGEHDLRGLDGPIRHVVLAALDPDPAARPTVHQLKAWLAPGQVSVPSPPTRPVGLRRPPASAAVSTEPLVAAQLDPDRATTEDWRWAEDEVETATADPRWGWESDLHPGTDPESDHDTHVEGHPDTVWDPDAEASPEPSTRTTALARLRSLTLLAGLAAVGAGALAWAPWVSGMLLVLLVWLLVAGSRASDAVRARRAVRGARWYDGVALALASPLHLLRALPTTVVLAGWALGVGLAVGLICFAVGLPETTSLGVMGVGVVVGVWAGPGGHLVRRPVGAALHTAAARPTAWLVTAAVVAAVASGFIALAQDGTHWDPGSDAPWRAISFSGLL